MEALTAAPGVIRKAARVFVAPKDVKALMECSDSMAYEMIKKLMMMQRTEGNTLFHQEL